MKIWLIEIIHNVDVLCNVIFWWLLGFAFVSHLKSSSLILNINRRLFMVWLIALMGVLFIPTKEALHLMLG